MAEYEAGEWPVDYGQSQCTVFEDTDIQFRVDCETVAINLLWNFTGRVFGTYDVTLRPIRQLERHQPTTFEGRGPIVNYPVGEAQGWLPVQIDGKWYNLRCGSCRGACVCLRPWNLQLPGPVADVMWVKIGADTVPSSSYRLDGDKLIHKTENWPTKQNMRLDIGEEDTWAVRYHRGLKVPRAGQLAAGILACEIGKGATGDQTCMLPKRVQTITRQGVTMAILDLYEDLKDGRIGVPAVDLWIASVNVPRSAARPPVSPDYRMA